MSSSQTNWAPNMFKGRIGEAIVESAFLDFGYIVRQAGMNGSAGRVGSESGD